MLTAESALALFLMLAISSISLFIAQRMKIPHTVLLVGIGVILGALSFLPPLHFFNEFTLTPELLFFIFLPTLIFESAFNIPIKHLSDDAPIISILSVISLIVSALLIALGMDWVFTWIGMDMPFIVSLIFGSIISATDPVAVLALFKEYGAPRRLSLIFEGESIFNDGTGVALFLVVLAIAESGVMGMGSLTEGTLSFVIMVIGGIIFGLIFGGFFVKLIGYTRSNEFASITLTMVLAHSTFICAELFSHYVMIGDTHIRLSSIIATAVASLLMGNYGRYKLPAHATEFVEKYWSQFAFIANSLIFIMIGMLAIQLPASATSLIVPITLSILIVAAARAISIYPIVEGFNALSHTAKRVPRAWQHVMAWGSLRGALAVTMVLMIPDNLTFPGWTHAFTPKELILTLTVSCVFATLFIKATTIGMLMKKLKLSTFTPLEEINYREMLIYVYDATLKKLKESHDKGYINKETFDIVLHEQQSRIKETLTELKDRSTDPALLEKVIRLHAIGIERKYVKGLFAFNEVSEVIIKRIMAKLEYQTHAIEHDTYHEGSYEHGHSQDVFEYLASLVHTIFGKEQTPEERATENYLYYRALSIISRKVVKQLSRLDSCFATDFALPHSAIQKTIAVYDTYRDGSQRKMEELKKEYPVHLALLDAQLASRALYKNESVLLTNLREREMVTPKVSIALSDRFASESI
jgi:CPA1 family monovalent cation:H+ antiporter